GNLGPGWVGYHFEAAFGRPVRIVNDAVMQALGGYEGGRMLFLGLGTGLGSALVTERVIIPLELGCLPFARRETMADRLGKRGRWRPITPARAPRTAVSMTQPSPPSAESGTRAAACCWSRAGNWSGCSLSSRTTPCPTASSPRTGRFSITPPRQSAGTSPHRP